MTAEVVVEGDGVGGVSGSEEAEAVAHPDGAGRHRVTAATASGHGTPTRVTAMRRASSWVSVDPARVWVPLSSAMPVADRHVERAESVVAVGRGGGGHGIRDQGDAAGRAVEGEAGDIGVHVDAVEHEFHRDPIVLERCDDRTRARDDGYRAWH